MRLLNRRQWLDANVENQAVGKDIANASKWAYFAFLAYANAVSAKTTNENIYVTFFKFMVCSKLFVHFKLGL